MAIFSRYSSVLEPDGTAMSVRAALGRINEALDEVLTEQEGDFDPTTRFAIAWFRIMGMGRKVRRRRQPRSRTEHGCGDS